MNSSTMKAATTWIGVVSAIACIGYLWQSGKLDEFLGHKDAKADAAPASRYPRPELIAGNGAFGLKLSKDAIQSLELIPTTVEPGREPIALPPMIGSINYDSERIFAIKPRFTGEISEFKQVDELREFTVNGSTTFKVCKRPVRAFDKVKQGDILAVFWSQMIGQQKAAFVDAISNVRVSQAMLSRQQSLLKTGSISLSALEQAELKLQTDSNAVMTAERFLRMWKLSDAEIKEIRDEANAIHEQKVPRDIVKEVQKWARVEIPVPIFDRENMNRELTILEKNPNLDEIIDPANYGVPLFKLADLSRLQIWVHPPEEYLPILRARLQRGRGGLKWRIRFQSEPADTLGPEMDVVDISPSLEPNQHTPMLYGYLDNKVGKYLIGQFVTATILIPPPPGTVEVPTESINPVEGKDYMFIVKPGTNDQFLIRRVSVAQSFKKVSFVRTKLLPEQERANQDMAPDAYKFEALQPGERIVTRGVLELTAALDEARNAQPKTKEK